MELRRSWSLELSPQLLGRLLVIGHVLAMHLLKDLRVILKTSLKNSLIRIACWWPSPRRHQCQTSEMRHRRCRTNVVQQDVLLDLLVQVLDEIVDPLKLIDLPSLKWVAPLVIITSKTPWSGVSIETSKVPQEGRTQDVRLGLLVRP